MAGWPTSPTCWLASPRLRWMSCTLSCTCTNPLVVCGLGPRRNVGPGVGEVPGVTLLDLNTVAQRLENQSSGSSAVSAAHGVIAQEVRDYLAAQRAAEV